ncbi:MULTISPECIES: 30S ribosomal protein S8 [Thermaerobacter]|uniref:Small ribosomal subunit protein uS8 n=1 Tax=Thermaerobacter composti TaxID=554949 RepID=A0ABZ0QQR5_9FIRM|nr:MULTISPECIES: 30S ribosomal protein S8 [Thermaerobacter]PZN09411.1 MAG: 30S ribosomal protein S8 [Bacillota bacterium]QBS37018.1 30S ribosomal protein S8 [Thermaerobacter sp. FW80]WPD19029.1 30S ribosomal protein S8 [Thermaerobacter composti]
MTMTDPIADMLTRIRNANMVGHERVDVPGSKIKRAIADILKQEGYIHDYQWIDDGKQGVIRIFLKYGPGKKRVIQGLKRISKPGRRIYASKDQIPRVLGGLGIAVLSTSRGIMTDKQARAEGVGGEVLCYIW